MDFWSLKIIKRKMPEFNSKQIKVDITSKSSKILVAIWKMIMHTKDKYDFKELKNLYAYSYG